eukprot:TRINITY_DN3011_c0_g1_i2.p1 TRINITY_DN3011_c0_g1~~TRINITY_DN3011_c0_g1_i2.p1  ORF type:complete len:251 (-),score=38.23 TRINITY_DN3011_c0_g1_i2:19-771(-)
MCIRDRSNKAKEPVVVQDKKVKAKVKKKPEAETVEGPSTAKTEENTSKTEPVKKEAVKKEPIVKEEATSAEATQALIAALKKIKKANLKTDGIDVQTVEDNIYKWHVKLFGFDQGSQIQQDMFMYESVTGKDHVLVEVAFTGGFPGVPPFMRVVYPRFHQYTGHITVGGSICVKDLTKTGWKEYGVTLLLNKTNPLSYREFVLSTFFIMIRNLLLEGNALVDLGSAGTEYTEIEGKQAFLRVAKQHGWSV